MLVHSLPGVATIHKSCHMKRNAWIKKHQEFFIKCKRITVRICQCAKLLRVLGERFQVKMTPISEQMVDEKVDSVMNRLQII